MTTYYLYGTVLTGQAVAANNRGDNIGNTTTLQKVFVNDDLHTSVSAEAIRFAIRYRFQLQGLNPNRTYDAVRGKLEFADEKRATWSAETGGAIDDDIMGFMDAAAAEQEREDEESPQGETADSQPRGKGKVKAKAKAKGTVTKRPSPLAIGRAVSLRPYRGELSFNCVSGEKEKGALSLYNAEMHTTEYQYSFGLNLGDVAAKHRIGEVVDAIVDPPQVAGNHARFSYDFSPQTIVFRVSSAHSSRIQNCFEHDEASRGISLKKLIEKVEAGDIPANELIVGGALVKSSDGEILKKLKVTTFAGVLSAAAEARTRISNLGQDYKAVAPKKAE